MQVRCVIQSAATNGGDCGTSCDVRILPLLLPLILLSTFPIASAWCPSSPFLLVTKSRDQGKIQQRRYRKALSSSRDDIQPWDSSDWQKALESQPIQVSPPQGIRIVSGSIPRDFPHGILYKAGPANFGRGSQDYAHWLEGDGSVLRLELGPGPNDVTFASQFVRTNVYQAEVGGTEILARGTFGTVKTKGWNAFDLNLRNPANTNALRVGERVLAFSDVGLPHSLDPNTLDTFGVETFDGSLHSGTSAAATLGLDFLGNAVDDLLGFGDSMSPHYRIMSSSCNSNSNSGEVATFASFRQDVIRGDIMVRLLELDIKSGECVGDGRVGTLPGVGFPPHDWAMTPTRAIFVTVPASGNIFPYVIGSKGPAECITFQQGVTGTLHLLPRPPALGENNNTGGDPPLFAEKRIELSRPIHPIHFANAWDLDEEDGVEVLACCWESDSIHEMAKTGASMLGSWAEVSSGNFVGVSSQKLLRITHQGNKDPSVEEVVKGLGHIDYVKCHPDKAGKKTRFLWGSMGIGVQDGPTPPGPPQIICRIDLDAGIVEDQWYAGRRKFLDEFVLVSKKKEQRSDDTSSNSKANLSDTEEDVWLVAPCFDAERQITSFVILDGHDLSAGPIFEAELDHHIPWALHGSWYSCPET